MRRCKAGSTGGARQIEAAGHEELNSVTPPDFTLTNHETPRGRRLTAVWFSGVVLVPGAETIPSSSEDTRCRLVGSLQFPAARSETKERPTKRKLKLARDGARAAAAEAAATAATAVAAAAATAAADAASTTGTTYA